MLPISELLTQYAAVFASLLSAFSSILAVEQYLDKLTTSNTHLLVLNPPMTFPPLLTHQEASQNALTKAHNDIIFLVLKLDQVILLEK